MSSALAQIQPTFQATWNNQNIHLKPAEKTRLQKIWRVVYLILSIVIFPIGIARAIGWAVHFVAKKLVLPAAWFYPGQIVKMAKHFFQMGCHNLTQFSIQEHVLATPDKVKLQALHFRHHRAGENTPTVLFFQSNAVMLQMGVYLWLINEAIRRHVVCNFVVFDYRGVGESQGDLSSTRELLIDGDTALQFVRDHLRVPPSQIHWYGWSLGGGVSTQVKSFYPECNGPLVNERSFSSIRSATEHSIPRFLKPFLFWFPCTAERYGWNLTAPLEKLHGRTLVVYHPRDPTIPYAASAHAAATKANLMMEAICLYQTPELMRDTVGRIVDHHCENLDLYYAAPGVKADHAIANFILPTN
jgi:hypothetical protein